DADEKDIKRAARKILAENHPDRNPGNAEAEERYKTASEAKEVPTDAAKRKEYDETRRLFAGGGFGRGRYSGGGGNFGGGFSGGDG
ncbi:molecular chaperone DnaJ, partial [Mycobacterium sp. ITM-2017-0098]